MTSNTKLVTPENKLKKKVGHGGFNETTLINAQKVIEENTIDFKPMGLEFLALLGQTLEGIKNDTLPSEEWHDQIMYPLMQLKAQGSLFHYPIITKISFVVVDFLENAPTLDKDSIEIVEAYKKAIHAILSLQIKEENSKIGKDLCDALVDACNRYYRAKGRV